MASLTSAATAGATASWTAKLLLKLCTSLLPYKSPPPTSACTPLPFVTPPAPFPLPCCTHTNDDRGTRHAASSPTAAAALACSPYNLLHARYHACHIAVKPPLHRPETVHTPDSPTMSTGFAASFWSSDYAGGTEASQQTAILHPD